MEYQLKHIRLPKDIVDMVEEYKDDKRIPSFTNAVVIIIDKILKGETNA